MLTKFIIWVQILAAFLMAQMPDLPDTELPPDTPPAIETEAPDDPEAPIETTPPETEAPPAIPARKGDILGLMYHHLVEDPAQVTTWTTTPDNLRKNLQDLLDMGYAPLSFEDYFSENYDPSKDYFIVTFDDGYLSNRTLAQPVLAEMEIPAAIFVITDLVGEAGYMTWEDLRAVQEAGVFTLYSHTHTHKNAQKSETEDFLADVSLARDAFEANLTGIDHRILSYPNGAITKESVESLVDQGYEMFVIQEKPKWYDEARHGRLLLRVNVPGMDADMKRIANYSRRRSGVDVIK